jgi:hypothetical protein
MALEGSAVVGACLNRPLTRDQVMGCAMPSSVGPAEDPLFANVVRMLITVHRQLDLFEAVGIDTFFEVGLVSVMPLDVLGRTRATLKDLQQLLSSIIQSVVYMLYQLSNSSYTASVILSPK